MYNVAFNAEGKIKMVSSGHIESDKLIVLEYDISDEIMEQIHTNEYDLVVEDGVPIAKKREHVAEKELELEKLNQLETAIANIANIDDVKTFLSSLLIETFKKEKAKDPVVKDHNGD